MSLSCHPARAKRVSLSSRTRSVSGSGVRIVWAAVAIIGLVACEREERRFSEMPPTATPTMMTVVSELQPGSAIVRTKIEEPYGDNAWAVSEGQRLFNQMNCSGCHANGGGAIGPALMDDEWIYGSAPQQIFASIAEGRPNGMPAWEYALSSQQIWELVAYVRSLSGLEPKGARSGRSDHMMVRPVPAQTPNAKPRTTVTPKSP
jgi:cytochrome c oxidase cbb3-type subunit III